MAAYTFQFVAGQLCLDLINTLGNRGNDRPDEHLTNYSELVRWAEAGGAIGPETARTLRAVAAEKRGHARRVVARAIGLREALHRTFMAVRRGDPAADEDLSLLNRELGAALAHARIRPAGDGYELGWADDPVSLDRPLWPVLKSAVDLLMSGELERVKSCASDTCNWVFMDESRNRSRQWCQMEVCGNRAKARRHYARQKSRRRERTRERQDGVRH
jgi:predicted RNA-binding Zn ribbon-like protein